MLFIVLSVLAILILSWNVIDFYFAYVPDDDQVGNEQRTNFEEQVAYDLMGIFLSPEEADKMRTEGFSELLLPENGAIEIDDDLIELGKEQFYKGTFKNELFMTDILGLLNGPLTLTNMFKAILELGGEATTNLQVALAEDVTIGDLTWKKGEKIDTGIDVAKGAITPLGFPLSVSEGRVRVGISCAACHAAVDRESGMVMEGVPNSDLEAGTLLALATNSSAYFPVAEIESIKDYVRDTSPTVTNAQGEKEALPDPDALEKAVDETLVKWPKGNFDVTADLTANPAQIPDLFTWGDHPYGWNGFAAVGPFKGLTTFNNKVHAFNSDSLSLTDHSSKLLGISKDVFIATILQRAAQDQYRYNPSSKISPTEFKENMDVTPNTVGVNESVKPPNYPDLTMFSPNGTTATSVGTEIGKENNAMSAFQNTLRPPKSKRVVKSETKTAGREVFERAGCIQCHAGPELTNHQIIPVEEIKTEPARAKALRKIGRVLKESYMYAPNTQTPLPPNPKVLPVPEEHIDEEQRNLAYAIGTNGGYKVKGLIGLETSAPYLHDGGVAVGKDLENELGVAGTLLSGKLPDPYNSLKALIDQELRQKVIQANLAVPDLKDVNVEGIGHEFWVDRTTGFTEKDQEAVIEYLLTLSNEHQLSE
ncbi:electron transport protein [Halalkalibacter alkalisediminis]|uniref:Electron transport protein n=1 Tax=Halalkalibacter alkalisediminis TaxID=935616 RepID=A0ABV6NMQ2_9BACI|nr:electron transport protein [Halalkalibacter alkalisediminis]